MLLIPIIPKQKFYILGSEQMKSRSYKQLYARMLRLEQCMLRVFLAR